MAKQKGKRGGARKNAGGGRKPPPRPSSSSGNNDRTNGADGGNGNGRRNRRPPRRYRPVHDEDATFRDALLDQGSAIHEMSSDGNCLFRSVSDQLYDDRGARHDVVRRDVCDHLENNREEFRHFLLMGDDDEDVIDIDEYISNMRGDGEWGGNVEVVVASRVYRRSVKVFSSEYANGVLSVPCDDEGGRDGADLLLSYHGNDHYNSVRPIDKRSARPNGGPSPATNDDKTKGAADKGKGAAPMRLEMTRGRPPTRGAACPCGSGLKYKKCCMAEEKRKKRQLARQAGGGVAEENGDGGRKKEGDFIGGFKVLTI